jgi:hypothetical protein
MLVGLRGKFFIPLSFPTAEMAIEAAVKAGQQKIDSGFVIISASASVLPRLE